MQNRYNLTQLKTQIAKLEFKTRKILKDFWPINLASFKKPGIVIVSLIQAPYSLKTFFLISLVSLLISVYFLFFGTYLAISKEVPTTGGEIREALFDNNLKKFNPVLEANNESEKKIISLLYHPLYNVTFPNYALEKSANPTIEPILLSKAPQWQDLEEKAPENRYKILRFELKKNIKWSDKTNITLSDVEYTFDRLKENMGNSQFRDAFSKIEFNRISETEFDLRSTVSNPQLIYIANFYPISKSFYENQSTEKLYNNLKSSRPTVTSGYFTITKDQVRDPDKENSPLRDNPIPDDTQDSFSMVFLSRNPVQNTDENINIDKYIFKRYTNIFDTAGAENQSLERAAKQGKIDIFSRTLGPNQETTTQIENAKLNLNKNIVNTNNYYNLYINIKRSDIFINQMVRKYVVCSLINYNIDEVLYTGIENIAREKRLIPIQFGQDIAPDCPANPRDVLDNKTFKLDEDVKNGIVRLQTCSRRCVNVSKISLLGLPDSEPLLSEIRNVLLSIGLTSDLVVGDNVIARLESKDYSLAFLPVTLFSRDPYPFFGAKAKDLSQIRLNNSKNIQDSKIEDNLNKYSISNLTDQEARNNLINFFSTEFVSVNLFKSKREINYSNRVFNIGKYLPSLYSTNIDIYKAMSQWYIVTKRVLK